MFHKYIKIEQLPLVIIIKIFFIKFIKKLEDALN
jgi:hypothetical protein